MRRYLFLIWFCGDIFWSESIISDEYSNNSYLIVAQKDKIDCVSNESGESETIYSIQNASAIDFDTKHKCIFWYNSHYKLLIKNCQRYNKEKITVLFNEEIPDVHAISYDWMSELLYFSNTKQKKIELVKVFFDDRKNVVRSTIINTASYPRGLIVHPKRGSLYWTEWGPKNAIMLRSNLDGTNLRVLIRDPDIEQPDSITIDYHNDMIYFIDSKLGFIASYDVNGQITILKVDDNEHLSTSGITLNRDYVFWYINSDIYELEKGNL